MENVPTSQEKHLDSLEHFSAVWLDSVVFISKLKVDKVSTGSVWSGSLLLADQF